MKGNDGKYMRLLLVVGALFILAACASIGRPGGGEYDYVPPKFIRSNPSIGEKNVTRNRISIEFDENVQVEDVMNKVVVSPAQKTMPAITANGHRVSVELRDTLIPNTTYTIDFSDAIRDLNESNVLDGFAIDFSTGDSIDSMRISGMVFEAGTLEPAQGMLVGVYSNLSDTAITTLPMERIAKTNQLGQFTIRGLKPGEYRIFALNDLNRDFHWDRTEDIAFYDMTISPSIRDSVVADTVTNEVGQDSVIFRTLRFYSPDDILLTWFNEGYKSQYLKDYSRPTRRQLLINLGAPSDTLPEITIANGPLAGLNIREWAKLNSNPTRDTLEYFITDTTLLAQDTLLLAMHYLRTDTAQMLTWGDDTVRAVYKAPHVSKKDAKKQQKAMQEAKEKRRLKMAQSLLPDTLREDTLYLNPLLRDTLMLDSLIGPDLTFLNFQSKGSSTQEVYLPLRFSVDQPLDTIIRSGIHFEVQRDTLWDTIAAPELMLEDTLGLGVLKYHMDYKWEPATKYRLSVDSAALVGIYDEWNKPYTLEFTTKALEDYSALYFNVTGVRDSAIVEIIGKDDKPLMSAPLKNGMAEFPYLQPGDIYARLFIDRNGNGKYDTGNLLEQIQPEEMFYFPKKLTLKKNWDVEQSWDIYETAVDMQKPKELVKNKPKEKKKRRRNPDGSYVKDDEDGDYEDEDEEDDYGYDGDFFGPGNRNGTSNVGDYNYFNNLRR
ncbi:MAG: Ig-like domain-containing protein [Muribaculum sp.]|nr:Ig-like domain-containing protein [Muribaculum sp.]